MKAIIKCLCGTLLSVCFFFVTCPAQTFSGLLLPKNSSYYGINLNDAVKSVYLKYKAVNDSLSEHERKRFAQLNDIRGANIYEAFNESGMLIRYLVGPIMPLQYVSDTVKLMENYEWDIKDLGKKSNYKRAIKSYYPVMDHNLLLKMNYSTFSDDNSLRDLSKFAYDEAYEYRYDNAGKVIEELNYHTFREDKKLPKTKPQMQDLFTRKTFVYNQKDQVINQKIIAGPLAKESEGGYTDLNTSSNFCEDLQFKYTYDVSGRIIQIVMFGCKEIMEQQEYTYHPAKDYVEQVKYYVTGEGGFAFPSKNFIKTFNEHGDIIKAAFITDNPPYSANEIRFYTYEYDKHGNWIKCNMFLQGTDQGSPTLIAERKIEYYHD